MRSINKPNKTPLWCKTYVYDEIKKKKQLEVKNHTNTSIKQRAWICKKKKKVLK